MPYEIVRVEVQCFKQGMVVRGASQLQRYNAIRRDELWWPIKAKGIAITRIGLNQAQFEQDTALIRVTPISAVADGIFTSDIDFQLSKDSVFDVFGKSLERFVTQAWEKFKAEQYQEDWRAYAFMTLYESDDTQVIMGPPVFRGYIPMDERLLTIATNEDF
jgi:hypothetical protein